MVSRQVAFHAVSLGLDVKATYAGTGTLANSPSLDGIFVPQHGRASSESTRRTAERRQCKIIPSKNESLRDKGHNPMGDIGWIRYV